MSLFRKIGWYSVSSIGTSLLNLLTLPLITTKLGPEQFGSFALAAALAGIVTGTAGSVCSLSLPVYLSHYKDKHRGEYLAAVMLLSIGAAWLSCAAVFGLYIAISGLFRIELLTPFALLIAMGACIASSVWAVCVEILTIEGRAKAYAAITVLQAVANAFVVSIVLFLLEDTEFALLWGFAAAAAVGAVAASVILVRTLHVRNLGTWLPIALRGSAASVTASLSETGKLAIERVYLGAMVGIAPLGLLAHAQYYKNASMVGLNAFSRGILPTALDEARMDKPYFPITLKLWVLVQAFVVTVSLAFTFLGREVIGMLTHGKFTSAANYTVGLLLVLLLQTAAKPHTILLVARGQGNVNANLYTISIIISLGWLFVSVPLFGIWGAISSFMFQNFIHRIAVYWAASRICKLAFADAWVVGGVSTVFGFAFALAWLEPTLVQRVTVLAILYAGIFWKIRPSLLLAWSSRRRH
jgi:O-antigen/teichoic acid export membrane protein